MPTTPRDEGHATPRLTSEPASPPRAEIRKVPSPEDSDIRLVSDGGDDSEFELTLDLGDDEEDGDDDFRLSPEDKRRMDDAASDMDFNIASSGINLEPSDDDPFGAESLMVADVPIGQLLPEVKAYRLPQALQPRSRSGSAGASAPPSPTAGDVPDLASKLQRVLQRLTSSTSGVTVEIIDDVAIIAGPRTVHDEVPDVLLQLARAIHDRPTYRVTASVRWLSDRERQSLERPPAAGASSQPIHTQPPTAGEVGLSATLACFDGHPAQVRAGGRQPRQPADAALTTPNAIFEITASPLADDESAVFLTLNVRIGTEALAGQLETACRVAVGQDTLIGTFPAPDRPAPSGNRSLCLIVHVDVNR